MVAEAEGYVKYQYYVLVKPATAAEPAPTFRIYYVPVEDRDGKRVQCGTPVCLSDRYDFVDAMLDIGEFDGWDADESDLADIAVPDGWELAAQFPLPDDYVPESKEVIDEGLHRAREYLRQIWGRNND